jgi:hypothetical protein
MSKILLSTTSRPALWPTQRSLQHCPWLSSSLKLPDLEADYSYLPTLEVKDAWCCTCSPPALIWSSIRLFFMCCLGEAISQLLSPTLSKLSEAATLPTCIPGCFIRISSVTPIILTDRFLTVIQ